MDKKKKRKVRKECGQPVPEMYVYIEKKKKLGNSPNTTPNMMTNSVLPKKKRQTNKHKSDEVKKIEN